MIRDDEEIQQNRGWLPTWWMAILYGSIVFSIGYVVYFHGIAGWTQDGQYAEEVKRYEEAFPTQSAILNDDGSNPYREDEAAISRGQKSFDSLCAACHKVDMSGLVGPSLVDSQWLHGSTDKAIYEVVMEGVPMEKTLQKPPKGIMPAHKVSLGSKKVLEVMAYIASKNPTFRAK